MKHLLLALSTAALLAAAGTANAGTIDTLPPDGYVVGLPHTGPDTLGGTFTADGSLLESLTINAQGGGGFFRVVVMSTTALGVPDALLWENGMDIAFGAAQDYTFSPNLALTSGEQYFVGTDTGNVTMSAIGEGGPGIRFDGTLIPGGSAYNNFNFGGFVAEPMSDIAARIVITPEPASMALFGLGLGALGFVIRRKRRPRVVAAD